MNKENTTHYFFLAPIYMATNFLSEKTLTIFHYLYKLFGHNRTDNKIKCKRKSFNFTYKNEWRLNGVFWAKLAIDFIDLHIIAMTGHIDAINNLPFLRVINKNYNIMGYA